MPARSVFEPEEIVLAGKVLEILEREGSKASQASISHILSVMDQLVHLRKVVTSYTSVIESHNVAGQHRDIHTLTDAICRSNPYTIEAYLPTRAVVGRSYQVAKFNFLRLLVITTRHHVPDGLGKDNLFEELSQLVRQGVIIMIAEDVLLSVASDHKLDVNLRRKATYKLADLWEYRTSRSVRDFFPLLETIWEAKARTTISYGTLTGTTEILTLMREGCDRSVVEYFTSDNISEEERQAWIELVFNATYEELEIMREYMERNHKQILAPEEVAKLFDLKPDELHQTITTPVDIFYTFRQRQVNAYHRKIQMQSGPKKTAEEYLMIFYLKQSNIQPPKIDLTCREIETVS